jgi:hypothetical protein
MSNIRQGALIVTVNKILSKYNTDHPAMDPLEAIINAGRFAELLSSTRALGTIDGSKFDAYRKLSKLRPLVTRELLKIAEELGHIEIQWSDDSPKNIISFKTVDNKADIVFSAANDIFNHTNPSNEALVILLLIEQTLMIPWPIDKIKSNLAKRFSEKYIDDAIKIAIELKLISITDETEEGEQLLFNPLSFENDASESYKVIEGLPENKKEEAIKILDYVQKNPGVPFPKGFDKQVIDLLINLGIIDYSKITTASKNHRYFPTTPYVWGTLQDLAGTPISNDLIDDAKLLLNSFRYGQFFSPSSKGRIKDPAWIVNALLREGTIGVVRPATAIGTDYPLPLSRGIVNIVESRMYPGRYSMELMKIDVAEAVRDVLVYKALPPSFKQPSDEDLQRVGQFSSPATVRVETELPENLQKMHEELIFNLRTLRKRK